MGLLNVGPILILTVRHSINPAQKKSNFDYSVWAANFFFLKLFSVFFNSRNKSKLILGEMKLLCVTPG